MKYFKIVKGDLTSFVSAYGRTTQYEVGKWVTAPPERLAYGYGLFVYDNINSALPNISTDGIYTMYECEIGPTLPLPTFGEGAYEDARRGQPQKCEQDIWPGGTVCTAAVKLTKRRGPFYKVCRRFENGHLMSVFANTFGLGIEYRQYRPNYTPKPNLNAGYGMTLFEGFENTCKFLMDVFDTKDMETLKALHHIEVFKCKPVTLIPLPPYGPAQAIDMINEQETPYISSIPWPDGTLMAEAMYLGARVKDGEGAE